MRSRPALRIALITGYAAGSVMVTLGSPAAVMAQREDCRHFVGQVCASVGGRRQTFSNACLARRMGGVVVRRGPCLRRTRPFPTGPGWRAPDRDADRRSGTGIGPFRRDVRRRGSAKDCAIDRPVCARVKGRRRQFETPCAARRAGAKEFRLGLCGRPSTRENRERAARSLCARTENPVCATKHGIRKTYRNACHATVDLAVVLRKGACRRP